MTTGRFLALMVLLAVPSAQAERAVSRGGSDSSSGSSSAEQSHPASGSSSGSSSSGSSSGHSTPSYSGSGSSSSSSSSSGRERAVPRSGTSYDSGATSRRGGGASASDRDGGRGYGSSGSSGASTRRDAGLSDAEKRHPRPGPHGTGYQGSGRYDDRYNGHYGHYSGHYYYGPYGHRVRYGHYGPHYHGSAYLTHSCYFYDDYHYYGRPYRYVYTEQDPSGAVRVLVDPSETKVYVDGYYAGTADDFDGIFQRLYLPPGRHEIALKLDGYKTQRVRLYSARGHTIKLHHDMQRGEGEGAVEDLGGAPAGEEQFVRDEDQEDPEARKGGLGTVKLSVKPADASVYVDGAFWGTGLDEDVKLPAGKHGIAVVRPGFESFEREIEVRPGESVEVEVDLRKS